MENFCLLSVCSRSVCSSFLFSLRPSPPTSRADGTRPWSWFCYRGLCHGWAPLILYNHLKHLEMIVLWTAQYINKVALVLCSCSSASSPASHLPHHQSGKQALLIPQCGSPVVFKLLSLMSLSLHFSTFSPWLRSGWTLRSISLFLMSWSIPSGIPHWKTHNLHLPTQQPMTSAKQTTGPPTASPPADSE